MRSRTLTTIKYGIVAIAIALAVSQATVIAQGDAPERSLEGVWQVSVTPHNCITGVPIPTAAFEALMAFHKDGTLSAWFQNSTITVTRSPFFGLWKSEQGWGEYSTKYVALQYNLTTGAFSARQVSQGTLVLGNSGDEFTSSGSTTVFFANGNPPVTGCSTSVGTRFE